MPNKETNRIQSECRIVGAIVQQGFTGKATGVTAKVAISKTVSKEAAMSPGSPERAELLGSLTTEQQQRTSARVIKKLRLEPDKDKRKRDDETPDCETPIKIVDEKELKFPMVKQRMPKALWSIEEKNHFFEALNEYGKDFDAITAFICAKMKKKGMADGNLKTKTQVSHFYYRTWHKLSKHVHFDENVKKVAQELYALINYGELRKKLVSVNEKTCARLGEMVLGGGIAVRARGRTLRVRTPMCRALRRLNQITERACGSRVCSRAQLLLRARDVAAWARVQAAAHNPRVAVSLPLRTRLVAFIDALQRRWKATYIKPVKLGIMSCKEDIQKEAEESLLVVRASNEVGEVNLESHLNLEPDRVIVEEQKLPKRPCLHVGPRPTAVVHIPTVSPSEQLSSQKICFSSYLERMGKVGNDGVAKIRTPKRQRKDSTTDKEKDMESKKSKVEDAESKQNVDPFHIDETAIDGIELMATYKINQDQVDEDKPNTEEELKSEETAEEEGDVTEKVDMQEMVKVEKDLTEKDKDILDKDISEREKDSFSEMEDDEKFVNESDNESDSKEKNEKEKKFKNLKVKFRIRPKKRGGSMYSVVLEGQDDNKSIEEVHAKEEEIKPDIDVDLAIRQIRKGWSVYDAGDLTIGDLYLIFGSRSKIELDYWWAEPTPPLPRAKPESPADKKVDKVDKTPDKTDSSVEEGDKRESDTDIFSPKAYNQDSNDGLSGDERKGEQLSSPDHKAPGGALKLVDKLVNRPTPLATQQNNGFSLLSDRLKRLLSLVGNANTHTAAGARCGCGHVCTMQRRVPVSYAQKQTYGAPSIAPSSRSDVVFRHPTPIAPRSDQEVNKSFTLEGVPRWRRGRPRADGHERRVVVQRLLPLLPKLPPPSNLIPVKIVPNAPPPLPKILPKPPPTSTSDLSFFYVLSESNGQFFFHDGDRRIPITPLPDKKDEPEEDEQGNEEDDEKELTSVEMLKSGYSDVGTAVVKTDTDIANFLPAESMSLSPSRLLRESEGWPEGSVQDFSLSSFLGHLDGRPQPDIHMDSHLHSLMAESSVDYVAKFADLAAEVSGEVSTLPTDELA